MVVYLIGFNMVKHRQHTRRWFLASTVTIAGLGVAGCTADDDGNGHTATPEQTPGLDPTPDPTPTPDEESPAPEEQEETEARIGELVEGDEMHLVVESFERDVDFGEFTEPDPGQEFVSVQVALKNVSDSFVSVSNLLQTRIRDDESYNYSQTFLGGGDPTFSDGQFAPGEVERGHINFEIPEDASGLKLVWDFDFDLFSGIDRAIIDLEDSVEVHEIEQDLRVEIHDLGETVRFDDIGVTLNEIRVEDDFGAFTEPAAGHEFLVLDITVENDTDEEQWISTFLQMHLKDGGGWSFQEDFGASTQLNQPFDEGSAILPGELRRGEIVYEVEEALSPLYWVFEFTLWVDGDKTFWAVR